MKVVVGGGSGYVGRALADSLACDGHEVVVVSRRPPAGGRRTVAWAAAQREIDGADAVVNLAGASIGGRRWTAARTAALRASRVATTRDLAAAIAAARRPPPVLVTASGVDYYGDSGDEVVDESTPAGASFLARLAVEWEAAAAGAAVRHVAVRTAFVVGSDAPALGLLALPFRLGVGGPVGGGRQWFPWIHLVDLVRVYRLALDDGGLAGPVNAVAPEALRQGDAARALAAVLHRPALVRTPAFAVRLALGEQADLLLHGQRAVSRRLGGLGFSYPGLRAALDEALARRPRPR
jgi:uncharacterized protein (TIGR01777 family)